MAARRGKGGRGRGNMENLENDRDVEIQAFRRRVEELTLCLEHQEARSERSSSHGYANDDSEHVNPFADRNFRNFVEKINRTAYVRVDIPEFHGHLQLEGFLDWLSAVEKIFEYKDIPDGKKVKLVATRLQHPRIRVCLVESNTRDEITERKVENHFLGKDEGKIVSEFPFGEFCSNYFYAIQYFAARQQKHD
ncbi:hypothetical protein ZIOFF_061776 [Zingiber officinale]|uniref:Uncharacterized protein n=1 Tax=Zingiber officinale TaxID=94328 RepID=A0A8J5F4P8_ZINOF|nr:hypothetical protein ZIOFF_061776 [Zingiber officinale]